MKITPSTCKLIEPTIHKKVKYVANRKTRRRRRRRRMIHSQSARHISHNNISSGSSPARRLSLNLMRGYCYRSPENKYAKKKRRKKRKYRKIIIIIIFFDMVHIERRVRARPVPASFCNHS